MLESTDNLNYYKSYLATSHPKLALVLSINPIIITFENTNDLGYFRSYLNIR